MKSLYIEGKPHAHVSLETGPSLQVVTPGRAHGIYPIYRIGRLFLKGEVEIETPALVTCLKHGISLTFIDGHGDPEGVCVGVRQRCANLQSLLDEFLEFDNWRDYFEIWKSAAVRQSILEVEGEMKVVIQDLRPRQAEDYLFNTLAKRYPGYDHRWAIHSLKGLCYGVVADRISKANINPAALLRRRENFELIGDFAGILSWKLFALVEENVFSLKKKTNLSMENIARWFEDKRESYESFVDVSLMNLENWLHNRMSL